MARSRAQQTDGMGLDTITPHVPSYRYFHRTRCGALCSPVRLMAAIVGDRSRLARRRVCRRRLRDRPERSYVHRAREL